jgi:hypothetical protein
MQIECTEDRSCWTSTATPNPSPSFQKLIESAERAEQMEALRASLDDMRAGKVIPAGEVLESA